MTMLYRPGYFGRRRDSIVTKLNIDYGENKWALQWIVVNTLYSFEEACKELYEESYYRYLRDRKDQLDFICSYGECIDNSETNIYSGLDYTKQEAFSTHIQDIAIRNVLSRLGLKFNGPKNKILVIRSKDSDGYMFGPGNIPFYLPECIVQPSLRPKWANINSVEDFWQSNKWVCLK